MPISPLRLDDDEVVAYQRQLKTAITAAREVGGRIPPTIEEDIATIINSPIQPPTVVDGEQAMAEATRCLGRIQKRRNRVLAMQCSCIDARDRLKQIYEECRGWLLQEERLQGLKNETQRGAAIRQVVGGVDQRIAKLDRWLRQVEAIHWALKGNQDALLAQIGLWRHEYWSEKQRDG